jgi:hypothetical protein
VLLRRMCPSHSVVPLLHVALSGLHITPDYWQSRYHSLQLNRADLHPWGAPNGQLWHRTL